MTGIQTAFTRDIPDVEYGEVELTRESGESSLTLRVKSPLIADFVEKMGQLTGSPRKQQIAFVNHIFSGWPLWGKLNNVPYYTLESTSNPLIGDSTGHGPCLTFLLDPAIREGLKITIDYPLDANHYSKVLGEAVSRFLDEHLAPFHAGYRFYFQKS